MSNEQQQATAKQDASSPNAKDSNTSKTSAKESANTKDKESNKLSKKRFENDGVTFKAKLIGSELVMEPSGDKMCQHSIQRLKAIIKGTNSHKKRVLLKISYNGVKVFDEKTNEILHHHEVSRISYIASDDNDTRAFGYVCDVPKKAHQFICFKTIGPAANVMSEISALFEAVLENKKENNNVGPQNDSDDPKETKKKGESANLGNLIDSKLDDLIFDDRNEEQTSNRVEAKKESLRANSSIADLESVAAAFPPFNLRQPPPAPPLVLPTQQPQPQPQPPQQDSQIDRSQHLTRGARPSPTTQISRQNSSAMDLISDCGIILGDGDVFVSSSTGADDSGFSNATGNISGINSPSEAIPIRPNNIFDIGGAGPSGSQTMDGGRARPPSLNRANKQSSSSDLAGLSREPSFSIASPNVKDSYVDRYAVFNEVDSWPSIIESTGSLSDVNKASSSSMILSPGAQSTASARLPNFPSHQVQYQQANPLLQAQPTMSQPQPQLLQQRKQIHYQFGNQPSSSPTPALGQEFGDPSAFVPMLSAGLRHINVNSQSGNDVMMSKSLSSHTGAGMMANRANASSTSNMVFRQANPFDDDFFK